MADYQHMYSILCDAASRALDLLPATQSNEAARHLLQRALEEAEECYIDGEEK